jgi:hypothetical protein
MASSLFTASLLPPPGVLGERSRLDSASDTANPACRGRSALRRCVILRSTRALASVTFLPGLANRDLPEGPDDMGILNRVFFLLPFRFWRGNEHKEMGGQNLRAVVRVNEAQRAPIHSVQTHLWAADHVESLFANTHTESQR